MATDETDLVGVRYIVDDVEAAVGFYTGLLGFTLRTRAGAAFADVTRGHLRLILSGPGSSGARAMPDGRQPVAGGWNRIVVVVDDIEAEVARLRDAGVTTFRNDVISGPGGSQTVFDDPAGNPVELFQPARG
jgi:catechol 2,3-dioxygenase-like lactoylglutathione lyase family enzyme